VVLDNVRTPKTTHWAAIVGTGCAIQDICAILTQIIIVAFVSTALSLGNTNGIGVGEPVTLAVAPPVVVRQPAAGLAMLQRHAFET